MRVLFAGTPAAAIPSLKRLASRGNQTNREGLLGGEELELVGVLSRPDAPVGRKRVLRASPVAEYAESQGIPVLRADRITEEIQERIQELSPEVIAVVAYGALVPAAALTLVPQGWINLHFSLLPAWRGAAPVQHALWHGDKTTGVSVFQIDAGLDTGPVFSQRAEEIRPGETASELLERLADIGADLLTETLLRLAEGGVVPQEQQGQPSLAPKLQSSDGRVDFKASAAEIEQKIQAFTTEPGAWALLKGQRIKVGPVRIPPESSVEAQPLAPGELAKHGKQILVGTSTQAVELSTVQAAGKRAMPAINWWQGLNPETGIIFDD